VDSGRTAFTNKVERASHPKGGLRVFKSSSDNKKLGHGMTVFTRGVFRGMPMYYLTLEERATCPSSCAQWDRCYGNHMPFAVRYKMDGLPKAIEADLEVLTRRHPQGVVLRLHVLGDFPDVAYVRLWDRLLQKFPTVRAFGYSHRRFAVARALDEVFLKHPGRFVINDSDGAAGSKVRPAARVFEHEADVTAGHVVCLEQVGRSKSCLDCGICMAPVHAPVAFLAH